jgi:hypothetical protein
MWISISFTIFGNGNAILKKGHADIKSYKVEQQKGGKGRHGVEGHRCRGGHIGHRRGRLGICREDGAYCKMTRRKEKPLLYRTRKSVATLRRSLILSSA